MTNDLQQARVEAERRYIPLDRPTMVTEQVAAQAFVDGAEWRAAADPVVTVEQIAQALFEEANGFAMTEEHEGGREWSLALSQAEAVLALFRGEVAGDA